MKGNETMDTKTMIIDLVNKIKYEVTAEQLAELSGSATPLSETEFVDWHAKIDEMDFSRDPSLSKGDRAAQVRELLHRVLGVARKVGGKTVRIGKRIVKWIFTLLERFPKTSMAIVVMTALCYLAACIPVLNTILVPLMQTVAMFTIGGVFLYELIAELMREIRLHVLTNW